jgi:tRNA 2-thiouridine synthesizing protein D
MSASSLVYTLVVTQGPYGHQGGATACRFAESLVTAGHRLHTVFFYLDGAMQGSGLVMPAADEVALLPRWTSLAHQSGCEMAVCVAAAERRGVLDETVAASHGAAHCNLTTPFRLAGLAELTAAMLDSDRVIEL